MLIKIVCNALFYLMRLKLCGIRLLLHWPGIYPLMTTLSKIDWGNWYNRSATFNFSLFLGSVNQRLSFANGFNECVRQLSCDFKVFRSPLSPAQLDCPIFNCHPLLCAFSEYYIAQSYLCHCVTVSETMSFAKDIRNTEVTKQLNE